MTEPVLRTDNLHMSFGGLVVTDGVSLDIGAGELHAVIGPNGAGKTTLINQISGQLRPTDGKIVFNGIDITPLPPNKRAELGLARSFQITSVLPRSPHWRTWRWRCRRAAAQAIVSSARRRARRH